MKPVIHSKEGITEKILALVKETPGILTSEIIDRLPFIDPWKVLDALDQLKDRGDIV